LLIIQPGEQPAKDRRELELKGRGMMSHPLVQKLEERVAKSANFTPDKGLVSTAIAYRTQLETFKRIFGPRAPGEILVWSNSYHPDVIYAAFDKLVVFPMTGYSYYMGAKRGIAKYIELAESAGFSVDVCSSIRAEVGVALSGELPKPDLLITNSEVCDGYGPWQFVAEQVGIPIYQIDTPYSDGDDAVQYMVKEFSRLIAYLEEMTGEKADLKKLDRIFKESLEAAEYNREINNLRKNVPSPMRGRDGMRLMGGGQSRGNPGAVAYLKALVEELKGRVERGEGAVPEEKHRLLWCQTPPFYVDLTTWMEEKYGAVVAFNDPHKEVWWQPGEYDGLPVLEALARQFITDPWNGPSERRVSTLVNNAREYRVNGAVHFNQWGCRVSSGHARMLADRLDEELGIPTLILDGDYMDFRNYSDGQVKTRLSAFLEML
jgi:benzoyl-CoA reductase/2-hydroxyglutaryl-CoA dehydratase subunit BcrC/BadD/HgdB